MAILSQFPTTMWKITLAESVDGLTPSHVAVSPAVVLRITGSGNVWILTLSEAIPLENAHVNVTHNGVPVRVLSVENAEIPGFLNQIRNILRIGITAEDLPDSSIRELAFLRNAELAVYEKTGKPEGTYDTESLVNPALRDRFRIAVMYRTAALLVPSLPDIVRESFLGELQQYAQIDWQEKINFFLSQSDDAIEEDLPEPDDTGPVGSVGSSYCRFTAF